MFHNKDQDQNNHSYALFLKVVLHHSEYHLVYQNMKWLDLKYDIHVHKDKTLLDQNDLRFQEFQDDSNQNAFQVLINLLISLIQSLFVLLKNHYHIFYFDKQNNKVLFLFAKAKISFSLLTIFHKRLFT